MNFFIQYGYLTVLAPLFAAALIMIYAFSNFYVSRRVTTAVTLISTTLGIVLSAGLLIYCINHPNTFIDTSFPWISIGSFNLYMGFLIDNLSAYMLLIVTTVSFLIQLYSYAYMKNDESFQRFFVYLNLFNFSMLGLVSATNIFQTYIFWELVGVCSYLLIGFWYKKNSASKAAKKAFWINRIGDFGLFVGVMSLVYFSVAGWGNLDIITAGYSNINAIADSMFSAVGEGAFVLICILILLGPIAKSAQLPLHVWLPDAMEGPTPVSALIHAATMVAAGVFLIARLYPVFTFSPSVMKVILIIGIVSAIFGAVVACCQNDIKKILAYSTISQLGFMFAALGCGALTAALFHLGIHAYVKAMLFLCAGILIYSTLGQHNIKYMGGFRKHFPLVAFAYLIGCISLSGFLLSGFYSKEAIFSALLAKEPFVYTLLAFVATFLTTFYIFRSYFIIFEGEYKGSVEIRPVNKIMLATVLIFTVPAMFLGAALYKNIGKFLFVTNPAEFHNSFWLAGISCLVIAAAFYCTWLIYKEKSFNIGRNRFLKKLVCNKFYFDELYALFTKYVFLPVCALVSLFDKYVIDGIVNMFGIVVRFCSKTVSKLQNGSFQQYAFYTMAFIVLFVLSTTVLFFRNLKG